ncbi:hypothetical protein [Ralstonia mannitolilytica]|uniref:hypothetical protein n=1 Tax=Ralstonia mannitolilytica TaxID=105219 RepID=UPI001C953256|nr:hypothetical protein [Ralstonia mannitolilytica]MBY4717572.1 hypothetical protein [Ralstonia mannitolilytica]
MQELLKQAMMSAVHENPKLLQKFPGLQEDKDIVEASLQHQRALYYLNETHRNDRELINKYAFIQSERGGWILTVFQHYGVAPLEGHDERNDYLIYNGDNFYYELAFSYLEKCWTLEGRWENSDQIRILGTPDYDYLKMLLLKLKIENETEDKATTNKRTKI